MKIFAVLGFFLFGPLSFACDPDHDLAPFSGRFELGSGHIENEVKKLEVGRIGDRPIIRYAVFTRSEGEETWHDTAWALIKEGSCYFTRAGVYPSSIPGGRVELTISDRLVPQGDALEIRVTFSRLYRFQDPDAYRVELTRWKMLPHDLLLSDEATLTLYVTLPEALATRYQRTP